MSKHFPRTLGYNALSILGAQKRWCLFKEKDAEKRNKIILKSECHSTLVTFFSVLHLLRPSLSCVIAATIAAPARSWTPGNRRPRRPLSSIVVIRLSTWPRLSRPLLSTYTIVTYRSWWETSGNHLDEVHKCHEFLYMVVTILDGDS